MKTVSSILAAAALLPGATAFADNPHPAQWNVRVEVMMVDIPQAKALALIPELRDPGKIDEAFAQVLAAIDHCQANLIGYPAVQTLDGERAVVETVIEKRYPTEFQPSAPLQPPHPPSPPSLAPLPPPPPRPAPAPEAAIPADFETRNAGVTLEVEPHVLQNGEWIRVSLIPQRVVFQGFDNFANKVVQPRFFTAKTTTTVAVHNGQRCLLAVHKLPDSQFELFILQAWAAPVK